MKNKDKIIEMFMAEFPKSLEVGKSYLNYMMILLVVEVILFLLTIYLWVYCHDNYVMIAPAVMSLVFHIFTTCHMRKTLNISTEYFFMCIVEKYDHNNDIDIVNDSTYDSFAKNAKFTFRIMCLLVLIVYIPLIVLYFLK